ncbi:hypothetical protein H8958_019241 [Nasalis larvatus]
MKVSVAVLSCLMLVAALGSQAQVTNDAETEFMSKLPLKDPVVLSSFHLATDCCISYISQSIPCSLMKSYFETSSECSKPGVIFLTKKGRQVCAKPSGPGVQNCMKKLKP